MLSLHDNAGNELATNDDYGESTNSRIVDFEIPGDEPITVEVNSFGGKGGEYTLIIYSNRNTVYNNNVTSNSECYSSNGLSFNFPTGWYIEEVQLSGERGIVLHSIAPFNEDEFSGLITGNRALESSEVYILISETTIDERFLDDDYDVIGETRYFMDESEYRTDFGQTLIIFQLSVQHGESRSEARSWIAIFSADESETHEPLLWEMVASIGSSECN